MGMDNNRNHESSLTIVRIRIITKSINHQSLPVIVINYRMGPHS